MDRGVESFETRVEATRQHGLGFLGGFRGWIANDPRGSKALTYFCRRARGGNSRRACLLRTGDRGSGDSRPVLRPERGGHFRSSDQEAAGGNQIQQQQHVITGWVKFLT